MIDKRWYWNIIGDKSPSSYKDGKWSCWDCWTYTVRSWCLPPFWPTQYTQGDLNLINNLWVCDDWQKVILKYHSETTSHHQTTRMESVLVGTAAQCTVRSWCLPTFWPTQYAQGNIHLAKNLWVCDDWQKVILKYYLERGKPPFNYKDGKCYCHDCGTVR